MRYYFPALICILLFIRCTPQQITIVPIDKEFDQQLITGKNLDTNFFNSGLLFQYFDIDHHTGHTGAEIARLARQYVYDNYTGVLDGQSRHTVIFYFYDHGKVSDYRELYESARDEEKGAVAGHNKDIVVRMIYDKTQGNTLHQYVYKGDSLLLEQTDTLENQNSRH